MSLPTSIVKRDGTIVPFDYTKISNAIWKCFISVFTQGKYTHDEHFYTKPLTHDFGREVSSRAFIKWGSQPTVEQVQDIVEEVLMDNKLYNEARHYVIYRNDKNRLRPYKGKFEELKRLAAAKVGSQDNDQTMGSLSASMLPYFGMFLIATNDGDVEGIRDAIVEISVVTDLLFPKVQAFIDSGEHERCFGDSTVYGSAYCENHSCSERVNCKSLIEANTAKNIRENSTRDKGDALG